MQSFRIDGWKPSNPGVEEPCFESKFFTPLRTTSHIIREYTPISDQGALGSCVANATADALEILQGIEDPSSVQPLSRLFIYFNARHMDGKGIRDEGTYIRNAFKSLKEIGVCLESEWPYIEGRVNKQPPLLSFRTAMGNKLKDFYPIINSGQNRIQDIEIAISNNHPVVFGAMIGKEFFSANDSIVNIPKSTIGGHAMIITGFNQNAFYVRNSWGKSWGDKTGHCWMSKDYIASSLCSDLWVPTVKNLVIS